MRGLFDNFAPSAYTESLDWKSLPPNSVIVDVGGGVGKVTYELYKVFSHLKYIVQDLPPVIKVAKKVVFQRGVLRIRLLTMILLCTVLGRSRPKGH